MYVPVCASIYIYIHMLRASGFAIAASPHLRVLAEDELRQLEAHKASWEFNQQRMMICHGIIVGNNG